MYNIQTILLLAPHPDDGEFGCGGTLKRFTEEGKTVYYAAFSPCVKSLPEGFPEDTLFNELAEAAAVLGIATKQLITYDFEVRDFPAQRQNILEELIRLRKRIQPDLVLMPNSLDMHQDHQTIHQEGLRAFKHTRILGYELPWNNLNFTNNCHVKLTREHINAKMTALKAYKSQAGRNYMDEEYFFGLARTRGIQLNFDYAEAFETVRWIV